MLAPNLASLDTSSQTADVWLQEVMRRLKWNDLEKAYRGLRAVLHALRDQMAIDAVADLQLGPGR